MCYALGNENTILMKLKFKCYLVYFFGFFLVQDYTAQVLYRVNNIPIYHGTKKLKSPFSGGLNASVINQMDLNKDGLKDLVIVHQNSFKVTTYLHEGAGEYQYAPRYETFFPRDFRGFFTVKDMNEDGMEDVIFATNIYFLLYKGTRINDSTFSFSLKDTIRSNSYDPLSGLDAIRPYSIYPPAIDDFDNDGDMDIVYFNYNNNLVFHKNYKKEKGYTNAFQNEFWKDNKCFGQMTYDVGPLRYIDNNCANIIKDYLSQIKICSQDTMNFK